MSTRRFAAADAGTTADVGTSGELTHDSTAAPATSPAAPEAGRDQASAQRPPLLLIFFTSPTSGACRRMHGLVAWIKVTRKASLSVVTADVQRHAPLARRLGVSEVPTLVLVRDGAPVARRVGRATGREIDEMLRPWLSAAGDGAPGAGAASAPDQAG